MPFCSECGREVNAGAKFCWNCGASLSQSASVSPGVPVPSSLSKKRPVSATAFEILSAIVGVGIIAFGILIYAIVPTTSTLVFGGVVLVLGVLALIVSYGLQRGRPWVRLLGTWSGVVYVVLGILFAAFGDIPVGLASILFGAATIYYLNKKNVKERLGGVPR